MDSLVGSAVGPYHVVRLLGKGGMGEVYLAHDTRLRRDVALKVLSTELAATGFYSRQLLREARAIAQLSHSNIASVFDVVEKDGRVHLVMEYLKGTTLADRLSRGGLSNDEFFRYADQISTAVAHAHDHGVLHCDLKPGNVFISQDDTVKVLDFGLARITASADSSAANTGGGLTTLLLDRAGTPRYSAPEQLAGRPVDQRSDVYSLGVVFRDMAAATETPADSSTPQQLAQSTTRVLDEARTYAARRTTTRPLGLETIIAKARAESPVDRFPTIRDLQAALAACRASSVPRVTRGSRSQRVAVVAAGTLAVASALLLSGLLFHQTHTASSAPPVVAILPFTADQTDSAAAAVAPGLTELVTNDLARGTTLVVVSDTAVRSAMLRGEGPVRSGRELGATHLVLGRVKTIGSRLRVDLEVLVTAVNRVGSKGTVEATYTSLASDRGALSQEVRHRLTDVGLPVPAIPAQPGTTPVDRLALEYYARGREYLLNADANRNLSLAIDQFTKSLERQSDFALAHAGLAEALWRRYRDTREVAAASQAQSAAFNALRLAPLDPTVRYAVAMTLQETGKSADAISEFEALVRAQPTSDDAQRALGGLYARAGQWDKAAAHFEASLALRPGYWRNYQAYGEACFDAGRYEQAIPLFQQAINFRPESAAAYQALGTTYHALGRIVDARRNYEQANRIEPTALAYSNLALIAYSEQRWNAAADAYRKSAELEPNDPVTWRNLGDTLAHTDNAGAATNAYQRAVDLTAAQLTINPSQPALISLQALCLAKQGSVTQARRRVAEALKLDATDGEALYHAAVIEVLAGKRQEALGYVRRSIDAGYSAAMIADDEDLQPLHSDTQFARLVKP